MFGRLASPICSRSKSRSKKAIVENLQQNLDRPLKSDISFRYLDRETADLA